jgi:TonB family protein
MRPARPRPRFRLRLGGRFSLADEPTLPVTGDRHPLRREAARRLILSSAIAFGLGLSVIGVWLVLSRLDFTRGPATRLRLPEREFRPGLRGEVMIMGEIAARTGTDPVTREGRRAGGAPQVAKKPDPGTVARAIGLPDEPAVATVPTGPTQLAGADSGAGAGGPGTVEMSAPAQVNPCFVLKRMICPVYPVDAGADQQRLPVVRVEAALYVDVTGVITASYILDSEGGPAFDRAVLAAVNAWLFEPVDDPDCEPLGFWIRLPVVFRNPLALEPR